jgi:hypothetical protein
MRDPEEGDPMSWAVLVRKTRSGLCGMMILAGSGCVGWRTETVPPRELLQGGEVNAVRIQKPDRTRVEMWNPAIVGDSITGHPTERAIARFTIPLSAVQTIETRHTSIGKTLLAALGIGAGVVAYALIQSLNQY